MKLYAKIQKIFDMTKLWLGKVGALLRIIQKETVSVTFDTASNFYFSKLTCPCIYAYESDEVLADNNNFISNV